MAHLTAVPSDPFDQAPALLRGVYESDGHSPPTVPDNARAMEIVDSSGRTIAYGWAIGEHCDDTQLASAWHWLDEHDAIPEPPTAPTPRACLHVLR
jgi:hypothetical protein